MSYERNFVCFLVCLLPFFCTSLAKTWSKPISIMTFNVGNLFDSRHDIGKNDYTYLPLKDKKLFGYHSRCASIHVKKWRRECFSLDWNEQTVVAKIHQLTQVIRQYDAGQGPDILILQEVENLSILNRLKSQLDKSSYQTSLLLEGPDERGIDVAILSKFPLIKSAKLHIIPFKQPSSRTRVGRSARITRGILEAHLEPFSGEKLVLFAMHFPSPFHPKWMRKQALLFLNDLSQRYSHHEKVIAAGDVNIIPEESNELLRGIMGKDWLVSHFIGCYECIGSHYYARKDSWSFLDMIFVLKKAISNGTMKIFRESIQVFRPSKQQIDRHGHPRSFDPSSLQGVSDHWPIVMKFSIR